MRVARDLVNKLALFFLPIFLFEFGRTSGLYAFTGVSEFKQGIISLGAYYFLYGLVALVTMVPLAQNIKKIGHQRTLVLSYCLRLASLALLYRVTTYPPLIFVALVFDGVQSNLFWPSYYTILSKSAVKNRMGQDLGVLQFLLQLVGVVSPAVSGIVAMIAGFESIFLVAIIGTLLGLLCTLFMDIKQERDSISFSEFRSWLTEPQYRKLTFSMVGRYINDAALFVWPLYVFIFLGALDKVGYLYTISLFIAMMFTFFATVYIDHSKTRKPFFLSGGLLSLLWLARTQVFSIFSIALVDVVDRLTANFHWLFYDMILVRRGKGKNALSYFVYREMIISATAMLFWLLFVLFFLVNLGWNSLFLFAAVGVMLSLLMKDKDRLDYVE